MGSCNSVICSNSTIEKVGKLKKQDESEEELREETPVFAIHINCTSHAGLCQSQSQSDHGDSSSVLSSSSSEDLEIYMAADESSSYTSDTSSSLYPWEDESDDARPQEDALESCPARSATKTLQHHGMARSATRTIQRHGLGQQNHAVLAPVEESAASSSKNGPVETFFKEGSNGDGESSNWAKEERPGPSGLQSEPNVTLPPPRPSKWKEVHSKKPKEKEHRAERKPRRPLMRKKRASLEEEMHAHKVQLVKKIKNSMKIEAEQESSSPDAVLPPDETIARIFDVAVEDLRDSSSNNSSSSCTPASSRSSTANSWDSSSAITSDEDLEEEPGTSSASEKSERVNNNKKGVNTSKEDLGRPNSASEGAITRPSCITPWGSSTSDEEFDEQPSAGRPKRRVKSKSVSAKSGQMGAIPKPSSTTPWGSITTSSDEEFEKPRGGRPKSTSDEQMGERTGSSSTISWDSTSTTSEEEFEKPNTGYPSNNGQMGTSSCSSGTNSWDRSTSSASEDCDEPNTNHPDVDVEQTPESENNEETTTSYSSTSSSFDSSSSDSGEDLENSAALESTKNGKKGASKFRRWFRLFRKNKVAPL